jgi:translation initiation factor 2 beta subunit (eIF-2beta)/eIF-5
LTPHVFDCSITGKVEGRGNGIKTVLMNVTEVAASLNREAPEVTKFFGCELGSQTTFSADTDRAIVNGAHRDQDLQSHLSRYIEYFVLCKNCRLPETHYKIKDGMISQKCLACGSKDTVDMTHKLTVRTCHGGHIVLCCLRFCSFKCRPISLSPGYPPFLHNRKHPSARADLSTFLPLFLPSGRSSQTFILAQHKKNKDASKATDKKDKKKDKSEKGEKADKPEKSEKDKSEKKEKKKDKGDKEKEDGEEGGEKKKEKSGKKKSSKGEEVGENVFGISAAAEEDDEEESDSKAAGKKTRSTSPGWPTQPLCAPALSVVCTCILAVLMRKLIPITYVFGSRLFGELRTLSEALDCVLPNPPCRWFAGAGGRRP